MPGSIFTDLLRNGTIDDPYRGSNDVRYRWIGRTPWSFNKTFTVAAALLEEHRSVLLEADGIDTVCNVTINGRRVGSVDNQFRRYRWPVEALLRVRHLLRGT